jgi:chaperonin GroEL
LQPTRQIALNAGEDGSIVVGKILEKDTYGFGFDAQSGEYVNMMSKGIIDPMWCAQHCRARHPSPAC